MIAVQQSPLTVAARPLAGRGAPAAPHARQAILEIVFRHRRLLPDFLNASRQPDGRRYAFHASRLDGFIGRSAPIRFVLPAFPAKSPNRAKTIGNMPDLGEHLALGFLQQLCDEIRAVYAPGATITICSDGHVFGGLVGVTDQDVTRYRDALQSIIGDLGADSLQLFGLADVFGGDDFDMMRDDLLVMHGRPVAEIREEARTQPTAKALFNGMHRFLFEDLASRHDSISRNSCREQAKRIAYRVIQRSNAWSALVAGRFPDALRLSIHPQPDVSEKIGIALIATDDPWITPWHSVALCDQDGFRLMKRSAAEAMGATLSYSREKLAYYLMPHVQPASELVAALSARRPSTLPQKHHEHI